MIARACRVPNHSALPHVFHKGVRFILGLKVQFSGIPSDQQPTLYVSNHISYLDVFVLGDIKAFFVAKSEVAGWPILGHFSKYQNTIFIERKPSKARGSLKVLQQHIIKGNSLILFPEGTSTNGMHVEPFKSSLFETVNIRGSDKQNIDIPIQPITVAYTHQNGNKMNQQMLDHYAWYASMPFASHFFTLFVLKKVNVKVHFHPVCYLSSFESRKQCAEHCENIVSVKLDEFVR